MGHPSEKVRARWRALIAEQQASGQSVAAFCRERGLRDGPFYEWKKRLQRAEASPFVAVEIAPAETPAVPSPLPVAPTSSMPIEIRLRYGRTLLVGPDFEANHLRRLLQVLEQEP
jgi:hypothetical protein